MSKKCIKLIDAGPRHCRWIEDEVSSGGTTICGLKSFKHTAWCKKHHAKVFYKPVKRKRGEPPKWRKTMTATQLRS